MGMIWMGPARGVGTWAGSWHSDEWKYLKSHPNRGWGLQETRPLLAQPRRGGHGHGLREDGSLGWGHGVGQEEEGVSAVMEWQGRAGESPALLLGGLHGV